MVKTYKGLAPLTLVTTTDGTLAYVYADHPAPTNVSREDIKRLVDSGHLVAVGSDEPVDSSSGGQGGGVVAAPDGTPAADAAAAAAAETEKKAAAAAARTSK